MVNCNGYFHSTGDGTIVKLADGYWQTEASAAGKYNGWLGPWQAQKLDCSVGNRVWCVSD